MMAKSWDKVKHLPEVDSVTEAMDYILHMAPADYQRLYESITALASASYNKGVTDTK